MASFDAIQNEIAATIRRSFENEARLHREELQRCHEQAEKTQSALKKRVSELEGKLGTFDYLTEENSRLRQALLHQQGNSEIVIDRNEVPLSHYKAIQDRCGQYAAQLDHANRMGQKYRNQCQVLQGKRERDKRAVRSWQEYHDRLMSRKREADQERLLSALDTPPRADMSHGDMAALVDTPATVLRSVSTSFESLLPASGTVNGAITSPMDGSPQKRTAERRRGQASHDTTKSQASVSPKKRTASTVALVLDDSEGEVLARPDATAGPKDTEINTVPDQMQVVPSSQSTDAEIEFDLPSPRKKAQRPSAEDEEPILVSARSLKRKRSPTKAKRASAPSTLIRIKSERGSSPISASLFARMRPEDTIDLDQEVVTFQTPRKKKRMIDLRRSIQPSAALDSPAPQLRTQRSNSLPPELDHCSFSRPMLLSSSDDGLQASKYFATASTRTLRPLDVNQPVAPRRSKPSGSRSSHTGARRRRGDVLIHEFSEDGEQYASSRPGQISSGETPKSETPRSVVGGRLDKLLSDANVSDSPSESRARSRQAKQANAQAQEQREDGALTVDHDSGRPAMLVAMRENGRLANEGSKSPAKTNPIEARTGHSGRDSPSIAPGTKTHTSIKGLGPPPGSTRGIKVKVTVVPDPPPLMTFTPANQNLPYFLSKCDEATAKTTATKATTTKDTKAIKATISPATNPRTPLRALPPTFLKPTDFRINPTANFGRTDAYTDVVRKHSERRCLPGCTDPSCCGSTIRKMLEIGGSVSKPSRGFWAPGSSQEDPDDALLRDYMGVNAACLASMTPEERKEMLMRAKTEEFASKVGRHKAQWARPRSPPGFWRADFPSTQEVERDREKVAEREREMVEERRREACRPGGKGRWRFVDE